MGITSSYNTTNGELTLKCEDQGNPPANVWWTKSGSYLNRTDIYLKNNNRTLVIGNPQPRDNGTYYCHARNTFFYANGSFTLNLLCKFCNDIEPIHKIIVFKAIWQK